MSSKASRHFEFREGSSNKFWEVTTSDNSLTTRWGKIGTDGQSKTKEFASTDAAEAEAASLINKKLEEGYSESAGSKPEPRADRPIDPKMAASVAKSWEQIDGWLAKHAPELLAKMGKGAKPKAMAEAEAALGVELPDDVRASYAIRDGSGGEWFFPSGELLSLDSMRIHHNNWKELIEEGMFDEDHSDPEGPIRTVHYHLKWIPLTTDGGGDHTLIDLAPAKGGKVGQLIDFNHETGPERVAARSLAEYLARFADALSESGIEPTGSGGLAWYKESDMARSAFPTASQQRAMQAVRQEEVRARRSSKHYLERSAGATHRFWEVVHDEKEVTTRFGKLGTRGRTMTKSYDSTGAAYSEASVAIARKIKEGYVEKT